MPASMDDEDFLKFTCGDMPSQEFAQDGVASQDGDEGFVDEPTKDDDEGFVDEPTKDDDEGFVDEPTPRRAVRGANFTQKEDEALCHAWRLLGIDPITGNEQSTNTYWERIHDQFEKHSKYRRSQISFQHRFQTINTDCSKWSGCLAQVDRLNPSGTSAIDKKKGGKPGKSFTSHHCWRILENDEKWKNRASNEIPNKRKAPSTSVGEGLVVDTDDEGSSSPTPLSSVNRKRPDGRKKAKDNRAKGGENLYKESLENMMAVRKELASERREAKNKEIEERRQAEERKVAVEERRAAAFEKLAEIEERKVSNEEMLKRIEQEQKIMFMDASGLDEKGHAYYELCRDQILMSRGYVGGNGGGGGGGNGGGGYGGGGYGGGNGAV